jgi:hypothetical protein
MIAGLDDNLVVRSKRGAAALADMKRETLVPDNLLNQAPVKYEVETSARVDKELAQATTSNWHRLGRGGGSRCGSTRSTGYSSRLRPVFVKISYLMKAPGHQRARSRR